MHNEQDLKNTPEYRSGIFRIDTCPDCGKEVSVDLSVVFADGMGDMYGTAVCCSACSKKRMEALK